MNTLVNGASGTVGTALAAHLRAEGHAVVAWDRPAAPPNDYAAMERYGSRWEIERIRRPDVRASQHHTSMLKTFEAVVEEDGRLRLLEPLRLPVQARALVTLLDDEGAELERASETALSDWNDPAEDTAWAPLQPAQ